MKVSHELPLSLLKYSKNWNDYEYCLPHLLDQNEQYRLHFQKARLDKRFIIMDNGLFEGVNHTTEDLLDKINLIRPNIFIVPDAWNDSSATLRNAKSWMINFKANLPEDVNLMAVCQGNDMSELMTTYQTLVDIGYKHIAFNHSSVAYINEYPDNSKLLAQMNGRVNFVKRLLETNTLIKSNYHHLLGCSLPQEFEQYKGMDFIKSVDTSNPIIVGAQGKRYEEHGLLYKPSEKLEVYFELDLSDRLEDIKFNVQQFKTYIS
jgi:hypothetical protein